MRTLYMGRTARLIIFSAGFFAISTATCVAQVPTVRWVQQGVSTNPLSGFGAALDRDGNIYVTGSLYGKANFGAVTLDSGVGLGLSITKYDLSGNVLWATNAGGTNWNSYAYANSRV